MDGGIILNEKQLQEARAKLARLEAATASGQALVRAAEGLPTEVIQQITIVMKVERDDLQEAIASYEDAKISGDATALSVRAQHDPGVILIVARIANGLTQKDLAWRLGMKEQQVQRNEADRYRSVSVKTYTRIASLLGVQLTAEIRSSRALRGLDKMIDDVSKEDIRKIFRHGRANGWFDEPMDEQKLRLLIAENRIDFGSPTLLRTGLNVTDHSTDILLHAWRARVVRRAEQIICNGIGKYDPTNTAWLVRLSKMSVHDDGPKRAQELLREHGIVLIVERQIPGLTIDGAAFVVDNMPVIGLTLRRDDLGNFWFSLLHEVAHIVLHRLTGLRGGFFDQFREEGELVNDVDAQELEADAFASNLLIPEERWRRSPVRIAKSPKVVEKFAKEIGIHPAIVFGRLRKERNDYTQFTQKIGANTVRKQFLSSSTEEVTNAAVSPRAPI